MMERLKAAHLLSPSFPLFLLSVSFFPSFFTPDLELSHLIFFLKNVLKHSLSPGQIMTLSHRSCQSDCTFKQ